MYVHTVRTIGTEAYDVEAQATVQINSCAALKTINNSSTATVVFAIATTTTPSIYYRVLAYLIPVSLTQRYHIRLGAGVKYLRVVQVF